MSARKPRSSNRPSSTGSTPVPPAAAPAAETHDELDKTPAQAEAEGIETVTIEWRGVALTVPAAIEDWPADAYFAVLDNRTAAAVRGVLGPKQTAAVLATSPRPTVADLQGELFDLIAEKMGHKSAGE